MNLSWSELMVVGIVALIVVGPKDLPGMFRELGRFTAKIRAMGREFSRAMEQAAKESGINDVADDLRKATNPKAMGLDAVKSAADKFEKWDPLKNAAKPTSPLPKRDLNAPAAVTETTPPEAAEAAPPAAAPAMGVETAALAEKQAARKAAAAEAAARLRAVNAGAAELEAELAPAEPAPRKPGRTRKKTTRPAGETA
ncbi:MAG: Sec-independent protein translocase protein TatB [Paracoccaceae bacterium]